MDDVTLRAETLRLLRCPVTQQPLQRASASELEKLGIDFPEGGFLTEDRSLAFRIENGMPILKPNEETKLGE
jgi:uncharacterized protein YbaR (Trm112 family)